MAIPYFTESLDSIPETLRSEYVEDADGGFRLNLDEPLVPKAKLDEFRNTNIKYKQELDKYNGVDVEEYKQLKSSKEKDVVKKKYADDEIEQLFDKRLSAKEQEWQSTLAAEKQARESVENKYRSTILENTVTQAATKAGVKAGAIQDVLLRAQREFSFDGDKLVAKDASGEVVYNKDGKPMQVTDWLGGLAKDAGHLFEASNGGGATGNKSGQVKKAYGSPIDMIKAGLQK